MSSRGVRAYRRASAPLWRRLFPLLLGLLFLLVAPIFAYAQGAGPDSVSLAWTSPGDDSLVGTATLYDMRISTAPITLGNWNSANIVTGLPAPLVHGTRQTTIVTGLSRDTTYYFAIRTRDDVGNWSGVSNVVRWDWIYDTAPPGAPSGVTAIRQSADARVTWTANSEPDLDGYSVYRAATSGGTYTRLTGSLLTATQYVDANVPGGATTMWYRVSATDLSGNESALSAPRSVDFTNGGGAVNTDWTMAPGYPNPSHKGQAVCVPVDLPASGAGPSVIDIVDSGGHRIRHIEVGTAATCAEGVLWDGRNDAGREVAPGVYRAWLTAGDVRQNIKLVRQP
jgi:hypothetical protein